MALIKEHLLYGDTRPETVYKIYILLFQQSGPMEKLTHIELTDIQCQDAKPRSFDVNASSIIIQVCCCLIILHL